MSSFQTAKSRRNFVGPLCEQLESRELLSVAPMVSKLPGYEKVFVGSGQSNAPAQPNLAGMLSGSVIFLNVNGTGSQRYHVVLHVSSQATDGLTTGTLNIDQLGSYTLRTSVGTNKIGLYIFNGAHGTGALVGKVITSPSGTSSSANVLHGEVFSLIDGNALHGIFRLTQRTSTSGTGTEAGTTGTGSGSGLGTPSVMVAPNVTGTGLTPGAGTAPIIIGSYSGSVILRPTIGFNGDSGSTSVDYSTRHRRVHTTLMLDSESPDGLATGTLTMNGVGAFPVIGSVTASAAILAFQADSGAGALALTPPASATSGSNTVTVGDSLNGDFFARIFDTALHGRTALTFNTSSVGNGTSGSGRGASGAGTGTGSATEMVQPTISSPFATVPINTNRDLLG